MDNYTELNSTLKINYAGNNGNQNVNHNIYQIVFNNEYIKSIPSNIFDNNYFWVNDVKIIIFSDMWDFSSLCIEGKRKSN